MIKRILVPLDPSPYTDAALECACAIARQHDAELTGLVILDIPGIERSIGPAPIGAYHYAEHLEEHRKQEASERIHSLLTKFKKKCQQEGVAHCEAERQGSPCDRILAESPYYDAVVIGLRTYFNFETSDKPGDSLEELLDHSVTPVYGVPKNFSLAHLSEGELKALIAFDGSLPAGRALQSFAQLALADQVEVTLLTSNENEEEARYYLDQAATYLKAHNLRNVKQEWTSRDIIQAMEEQYLDWADFVVVGPHAKRGLLDFILGSLTRYLIKADKKPLLIG